MTGPRPRRRAASRTLPLLAGLAVALLLTACSSGSGESDGANPGLEPTEPTAASQHGPVTLDVPDGFEAADPAGPEGPFQLLGPVADDGTRALVTIRSEQTPRGLGEASSALTGLEEGSGATDVVDDALDWPGTDEARFVSYRKTLDAGGTEVPVQYEFLLMRAEGRNVVVGGGAPQDAFDESGIHDALSTARLALSGS